MSHYVTSKFAPPYIVTVLTIEYVGLSPNDERYVNGHPIGVEAKRPAGIAVTSCPHGFRRTFRVADLPNRWVTSARR